ncbi:MAG TPA: acyl-ACP thioesterase domain-containing protein [Acidimicrobiia bacterium]
MAGDELVSRPASGRRFAGTARVRLADVSPGGRLRLDAIARLLQDVSGDDTADAAHAPDAAWVVRRLVIELDDRRTPRLYDDLTLVTWCSGTGARWAERRTDVELAGEVVVRAGALWVLVDPATGRPIPLGAGFDAVYGEAAGGRRVGQRLRHGPPPAGARGAPWPLRVTDIDVLGHVNNAAYWAPVEEALARLAAGRRVARAELEFRSGIEPTDAVEVVALVVPGGAGDEGDELRAWLTVGSDVRASAVVQLAPLPAPAPGRRF